MNKRIAIIGTRGYPSYYGGFETAVRRLAPYLADNGWEVTVYGRRGTVINNDPSVDPRVRRVATWGLESKSLSTLTYGLSSTLHALIHRPTAVIAMNCANGYWLPLLKMARIPTAVNVDGIEWEREKWGRLAKLVFKLGAQLTAFFADTIIADSHEIARRWSTDFGRQSEFIPYGGDTPGTLPLEPPFHKGQYILVVARFVPENSIPLFFEAIRKLNGAHTVVIVGSSGYGGSLDDEARELADQYENVHWLGHIADDTRLKSLWQHAGTYFHGHSVGGTNPALVQAMACGAPIVARDTPYNREVLGDAGVFVSPDANAIAQKLSATMELVSSRSYNPEASIRRANTQYSWELVCSKYEKTVLDLIECYKSSKIFNIKK